MNQRNTESERRNGFAVSIQEPSDPEDAVDDLKADGDFLAPLSETPRETAERLGAGDSTTDTLHEVNGVSEAISNSLCDAGARPRPDLEKVTVNDVAALDGVSEMAMRINLDVGG